MNDETNLCNDALATAFLQNARSALGMERGFILRTIALARRLQADAAPCTICDGPVMTGALTLVDEAGERGKEFAHQLCFLRKRTEELEGGQVLEHRFLGEARRG